MLAAAVRAANPQPHHPQQTRQATTEPQAGSSSTVKTKHRRSKKSAANVPPKPIPSLATRLPQYSPALESGILIDTLKAGMNAPGNQASGNDGGSGQPGGASKGKRKVVRVRG